MAAALLASLQLPRAAARAQVGGPACEPQHELIVRLEQTENVELEWTIKIHRGQRRVTPSEVVEFRLELPASLETKTIEVAKVKFVNEEDRLIGCKDLKQHDESVARDLEPPSAKKTCIEWEVPESLTGQLSLDRHLPEKELGRFGKRLKLLVADKLDESICGTSDVFKLKRP